jgi:hypothetical protein
MADAPMTVVETEEFLRKAKPLMSQSERERMVMFEMKRLVPALVAGYPRKA